MTHAHAYVIKADIKNFGLPSYVFLSQKTMYGGKKIVEGDTIFVFASENEGGQGLALRGIVQQATPVPHKVGIERQTPRVNVTVRSTGVAKRALGRAELRVFDSWNDGKPQTELNFKFYRQATNKIGGISAEAAKFLSSHF